jgi:hypothetical protein
LPFPPDAVSDPVYAVPTVPLVGNVPEMTIWESPLLQPISRIPATKKANTRASKLRERIEIPPFEFHLVAWGNTQRKFAHYFVPCELGRLKTEPKNDGAGGQLTFGF